MVEGILQRVSPRPAGKMSAHLHQWSPEADHRPVLVPVLLKENSHDLLSRCLPRSLVGVFHDGPMAADVSAPRPYRAVRVVNGGGTRATKLCRTAQPGPPLLGACRE